MDNLSWSIVLAALHKEGVISSWQEKASGAFLLSCLMHQERTPSLILWPSGCFKCHGCSWEGDIESLLERLVGTGGWINRWERIKNHMRRLGADISGQLELNLGEEHEQKDR